jgi:hypothetical protein
VPVVGYGRKTQEGGDTLGGRSATELSANITKLNQALTGDADIRRISLVGCNTMVVCVGCLRASLRVLSLTLSSGSVWIRTWWSWLAN